MGLFSKKEEIGTFEIYHHPNGELVFLNSLDSTMTIMNFALFIGKLVYDLDARRADELWRLMYRLASDIFENVIRKETDVPLLQRRYDYKTKYTVVQSSSASNPMKETAKLVKKGEHFFCETSTSPMAYPNAEDTVIAGCETLFVHLFNTGTNDIKFFLPVAMMAQCNWYVDNGLPSISQITAAPYVGFIAMQRLAQEMKEQ